MKRWIPFLLIGLLLAGCGTQPAEEPKEKPQTEEQSAETTEETEKEPEAGYRQITMEEAISLMDTESDYVILDVRTKEEYAEGHIPGAICIPNETIGTEKIDELPEKDQMILVYCRSGNRSKQASEKLAAAGYTDIIEFGGIIDWPKEVVTE